MSKLSNGTPIEPLYGKNAPAPEVRADPAPEGREDPQGSVMDDEENLDEAIEETFPASDPISPSRIDGPNN
ncbi:hypothetical protein GCM10011390_17860 [Aureimonas endophytica]|uniref:Uncharacterized protein n=1 Tax=Aureimonas endophytica TaxID=2027858 RepID=A0A917E470_9HYPH|nr:hypothetical protein [Aureimonas endophytica]GGD99476.1 hypothetical protein GCM10011390_17860 [Aureimonas endophytica]